MTKGAGSGCSSSRSSGPPFLRVRPAATSNQLEDAGPGVLLFIAPATRLEILWGEITRQMESGPDGFKLEAVETSNQMHRARVMGPAKQDKRLLLVSWPLLLDRMAADVHPDSLVASDIRQLRGLAQREDDEAFRPIKTAELSPSVPRRLQWHNRLIDDVIDSRGCPEGWMSTDGFRATAQRGRLRAVFRFHDRSGRSDSRLLVPVCELPPVGNQWRYSLVAADLQRRPDQPSPSSGQRTLTGRAWGEQRSFRRANLPDARSGIWACPG